MAQGSSVMNQLAFQFQEEQRKTREWLTDVQEFLSHDTSKTRRQLAEALRQQAELIEIEIQ